MARWLLDVLVLVVVVMASSVSPSGGEGLVPSLPASVTSDSSSLYNIWSHALRNQKDAQGQPKESSQQGPKTLLNPDHFRMVNLVPQGAPHPLYHKDYVPLRTEFLQDYMLGEAITPDDPRMTQPEGLTVLNLNGKALTFKKDSEGKTSVNGIATTGVETLSDGLVSYTLSTFLFDHHQRVEEARVEIQKNSPVTGPFGRPMGIRPPGPPQ